MIVFRDVHKGFGTKQVLQGFSLEVPEGETTVIIGYSGSGKSVALKHVVGLIDPDKGEVDVDGQIVHPMSRICVAVRDAQISTSRRLRTVS